MQTTLARRGFLKQSLAGAALLVPGAAPVARSAPAPAKAPAANALTASPAGLTTYELGPQIWIRYDNQPVTCYRAHRSQKYPYCYPLSGPVSGLSLTSETSLPYPHHRSLFFACDRVNGGNFWQEDYDRGQILSTGPKIGPATGQSVQILDQCDWQKPGGPVVMKDTRRLTVTIASPRLHFVDWDLAWSAVQDVTIEKTNHALFSARAAGDIVPPAGGHLVNAEGDRLEKGTFGKPSAWVAFYGRRAGTAGDLVEGLAILDHPANPWSPCPWFTRDYGFLSPTVFNFMEKPWKLPAGQSVRLRYRVVLFAGTPGETNLTRIHQDWSAGSAS